MTSVGGNGAAAVQATQAVAAVRAGGVATSPAIRRRAHEAGIDLRQIAGSGPNGRIVPKTGRLRGAPRAAADAVAGSAQGSAASGAAEPRVAPSGATQEIKVIGLRRLIASA